MAISGSRDSKINWKSPDPDIATSKIKLILERSLEGVRPPGSPFVVLEWCKSKCQRGPRPAAFVHIGPGGALGVRQDRSGTSGSKSSSIAGRCTATISMSAGSVNVGERTCRSQQQLSLHRIQVDLRRREFNPTCGSIVHKFNAF